MSREVCCKPDPGQARPLRFFGWREGGLPLRGWDGLLLRKYHIFNNLFFPAAFWTGLIRCATNLSAERNERNPNKAVTVVILVCNKGNFIAQVSPPLIPPAPLLPAGDLIRPSPSGSPRHATGAIRVIEIHSSNI